MNTLNEHDVVELIDDYSKRELPKGSVGTIVYIYPSKDTYEVEFKHGLVLTLQHYQIKLKESKNPTDRRGMKRQWRRKNNLQLNRDCCFNCRFYEGKNSMIGFCFRMSKDLEIPIIECGVYATYVCTHFISREELWNKKK